MKIALKRGTLLSLIAVIAILTGFTSTKVESKFKAIHISWLFTVLQDGELVPQRQSIDVFYSKDYLIARTRLNNFTINTRLKPGTNEVIDEKVIIDSSYVYFISKRGEKFGLAFDSLSMKTARHIKLDVKTGNPIRLDVDSFVRSTLTPPAFFYGVKSKGKDSMSVVRDEKKGILIEKFLNKRREVQEPDSSYFYFRKKTMEFSFIVKDKRADNMYLYKARAICNPAPKGTFSNVNVDVKKYEHKFEITEIDVPEEELIKVMDCFRNSIDELKIWPAIKGK